MDNKLCFDNVCALAPPEDRVTVMEGHLRHCRLVGGGVEYQYMIHASDICAISTISYQDVFDKWKAQVADGRKRRIESLKKQLAGLEDGGEAE